MRESRRPPPLHGRSSAVSPQGFRRASFFCCPCRRKPPLRVTPQATPGAAAAVWVPRPLVWHCSLVRPSPALRAAGLGLTSCAAARRHFLFNVFMLTLAVCSTCRNSLVLSTLRCVAFSRAKQAVSGCGMATFALPFVPFRLHARSLCRMVPGRLPIWLQYFNQAWWCGQNRSCLLCAARSFRSCPVWACRGLRGVGAGRLAGRGQ